MKKVLAITLLIMVLMVGVSEASRKCRVTNEYYNETNTYNTIEDDSFPLYVGAEIELVPKELRGDFFKGITGSYYADSLDISNFKGGHCAFITAKFDPWAFFDKTE